MKAFGFTIVKSCDLEDIKSRILDVESAQNNFNTLASRQTEAQISVFSQMESRLKLMEGLHGVVFEAHDIGDLSRSGQGRHMKIKGKELADLKRKFSGGYKAIQRVINQEKNDFKKWGIKKK